MGTGLDQRTPYHPINPPAMGDRSQSTLTGAADPPRFKHNNLANGPRTEDTNDRRGGQM